MNKNYLKYILAVFFTFVILFSNKVSAAVNSNDYTIESYHIDMVVNEDNTFDITERITAYFNVPKHGIYRKIPLKNSVVRADGTKSNNRARITNISVSEEYITSKENGYEVIKIGSENSTIKGEHSYTIKYSYNIGKDPLKDVDELYFNLIGNEWDTSINNVTFNITMPKEFDKSLLGFSTGNKGSTDSSNVSYNVYGNVISGTLTNTLNAEEGVTVRLTLPEGYFTKVSNNIDVYPIITIFLCVIFVFIAFFFWSKYGKDEKVIETVEFYPPEGFNSAEVGFLYSGNADEKSVISLLIYLANQGYLKIEEIETKVLFSKSKDFRITKLKEYDGTNECERIFFNGLFKNSSKIDYFEVTQIIKDAKKQGNQITYKDAVELANENDITKEYVTSSDLYNRFYITLNKIKSKLNSKENKKKIFENSASGKGKWLILMIIAIFLLITIKPVAAYSGYENLIFALLFPGIGFSVLFGMVFGKTPIFQKIFGFIWGMGFGGMPWIFMVLPALIDNNIYLITYIIGIICVAILILFIKIMPKRTPYGNELLGKLKGFKRFLETAEKPQLEKLVINNPEYFYNILPYTYALGVSDKWINQFETIALKAPSWYDSSNDFNVHTFSVFMHSTMNSVSSAMSSSPSSGSSGGGSSGGGSGGGGGGSW